MPQKKSAAKKAAAAKKPAKKGAAPKPSPARKPAKKAAAKKPAPRTAAQKTAAGTAAPKRKSAKKAADANKRAPAKSAGKAKAKASELIRRSSHTPAVFKTASKRPAHILFTMEEVREVLRKRADEEKQNAAAERENAARKSPQAAQNKVDPSAPQTKSRHQAASIEDILGLTGGGARDGRDTVPRKLQKYYDLLIQLRNEVRDELNLHSNDTLKRSQKEDAGDIAISVDAGTDNFDRDFALSLLSSEQEALNEIEAAIQRIHKGTYGVCEVTGEPISAERLEAVPFTRFSVEGQKQYEQNARKRISRAGAFLNESSGEKITFGDDDGDN
jgi:RNA polymerase-binding transcription factor DksA